MTARWMVFAVAAVAGLAPAAVSQADVYFWRDARGVANYSDVCPGVHCQPKRIDGSATSFTGSSPAPSIASPTYTTPGAAVAATSGSPASYYAPGTGGHAGGALSSAGGSLGGGGGSSGGGGSGGGGASGVSRTNLTQASAGLPSSASV